jgi:hemerythrin
MEAHMELFTWYSKYSVNDEELDEHHKKLFGIFNKLYNHCFVEKSINCLGPIIEELKSYSNYHFLAEEKHMKDMGYKEIDMHKNEHREFAIKTLQLQQLAEKNELEATKEFVVFLGTWLLQHVIEEDKKFSVRVGK